MDARTEKNSAVRKPLTRGWVITLFAIILAAAFVVSLSLGSVSIPLKEVIKILVGKPALKESWTTIILNFRLTKSLTAVLAVAALSVAGLQMQTMFRNPLA